MYTSHDRTRCRAVLIALAMALAAAACSEDAPQAKPPAATETSAAEHADTEAGGHTAHAAQAAQAAHAVHDWCAGHGLPESKCTKCNPELIEKFQAAGDWCAEHGFPESACPICNPQKAPAPPPAPRASSRSWP